MVSPIPMMLLLGSWAYPALRPPRRFGQHEVPSRTVPLFFVPSLAHARVLALVRVHFFPTSVPSLSFFASLRSTCPMFLFLRFPRPSCRLFLSLVPVSFFFFPTAVPRFDRRARTVGSSLCLELHQRFSAAWDGRGSISIGVVGLGVRRLGQCSRVGCVSSRGLVLSIRTTSRASTTHLWCRCHHSCGELRHGVWSWVFTRCRTHNTHTHVGGRSTNPTHQ